jgi:hypothetical protein
LIQQSDLNQRSKLNQRQCDINVIYQHCGDVLCEYELYEFETVGYEKDRLCGLVVRTKREADCSPPTNAEVVKTYGE